jgi:hypothetical protein
MLTPADKKWIEEKLAKELKSELKPVRDSVDLLRGKISDIHFEKFDLEQRLNSMQAYNIRMEEKMDKLLNIGDGNAGNIADLEQENKMGAITLRRHDIQIHELATATGTKISD